MAADDESVTGEEFGDCVRRNPLSYAENTTAAQRQFDAENLFIQNPAIFPELPSSLDHVYVKFRDLGKDIDPLTRNLNLGVEEDHKEVPAIEAGLKFSF